MSYNALTRVPQIGLQFEVVLETRAAVQRIEATAEATHVGVTSILTTVQTMVDLKGTLTAQGSGHEWLS